MPETIEQLSEELTEKWGEKVKAVVFPLNRLIGEALASGDLLAFGFISQAVAAVMLQSVEIAKEIKAQRGHGEVLH